MPTYKRPPITEAVVEVSIGTPLDKDLLDRAQKRFLETYPAPPQTVMALGVEIGDKGAKVKQDVEGYRLASGDGADILVLGPSRITTSRLAPYEGWDRFFARAQDNWNEWKRLVGWREITRVGVRYINRIDVPNPDGAAIQLQDYLTVSPRMPTSAGLPPMSHFAVNTQTPLGKDDCVLILNVGSTPSPLVKTASFIVDLDISVETELPKNDESLWALVSTIRGHKNVVFEACITDRARELFS